MGEMNDRRKALVKKAFNVIDKDKSGVLDTTDIRSCYNAKKHPDVLAGKRTEDEILLEFLDTFEAAFAQKNSGSTRDGKVSPDEFLEYYQNISASIDNDDYFEVMMTNTWNLDNKKPAQKAWAGEFWIWTPTPAKAATLKAWMPYRKVKDKGSSLIVY